MDHIHLKVPTILNASDDTAFPLFVVFTPGMEMMYTAEAALA